MKMNGRIWGHRIALLAVCAVGAGSLVLKTPGRVGAQTRSPAVGSDQVALTISPRMPKGAIALFSGKAEDLSANWYQRRTHNPPNWTVSSDGVATPRGADITSKQEFGDCCLHVEFREPADASGHPITSGNSGVGLQGRYEIQILNTYGSRPESHGCGALYSQKPPRVNASKPAGEWQTFDIIFRAPRVDANGQVTEQPRATVFQNGVLVQNNESFDGPTGIQYGEFHGQPATGPLVLQGDHDPVQFRSVWMVPL
jgi:3-keto-disaccharide hydrolase